MFSMDVFLNTPFFCLLPNWEIMDDNNTYFSGTVRDKQLTKTKEFILFVFLLFMVSRLECRTLWILGKKLYNGTVSPG